MIFVLDEFPRSANYYLHKFYGISHSCLLKKIFFFFRKRPKTENIVAIPSFANAPLKVNSSGLIKFVCLLYPVLNLLSFNLYRLPSGFICSVNSIHQTSFIVGCIINYFVFFYKSIGADS